MKTLLFTLLLSLSISVQARTVYVCDSQGNCEYITIFDNNYNTGNADNALINQISNSGRQNFETINRGWNPQQYRSYQPYQPSRQSGAFIPNPEDFNEDEFDTDNFDY